MTENYQAGDIDMLAHDLHNPLGMLVPTLDVMRLMANDADIQKMANDAFGAVKRQQFLLENYFDYLRLQTSESIEFNLTLLDIRQLQAEIEANLDNIALRCPVEFLPITGPLPSIRGDSYWFKRVVEALLDNAAKFCVAQDQIKVQLCQEAGWLGLEIADTGRPILPAYHDRLFTLEGQFEARLKGSRTSVGMNLPFAKAAMKAMNGEIHARSKGTWTIFRIQLPLAVAPLG